MAAELHRSRPAKHTDTPRATRRRRRGSVRDPTGKARPSRADAKRKDGTHLDGRDEVLASIRAMADPGAVTAEKPRRAGDADNRAEGAGRSRTKNRAAKRKRKRASSRRVGEVAAKRAEKTVAKAHTRDRPSGPGPGRCRPRRPCGPRHDLERSSTWPDSCRQKLLPVGAELIAAITISGSRADSPNVAARSRSGTMGPEAGNDPVLPIDQSRAWTGPEASRVCPWRPSSPPLFGSFADSSAACPLSPLRPHAFHASSAHSPPDCRPSPASSCLIVLDRPRVAFRAALEARHCPAHRGVPDSSSAISANSAIASR